MKGKAINLLMRTIQVDGNFAEAYSMLASLCTLSSGPREKFFSLSSTYSSSSSSLSNASDSIVSAGCPADIGKLHLKALQLSPYNGDIINDYGAFLHMTGKVSTSEEGNKMSKTHFHYTFISILTLKPFHFRIFFSLFLTLFSVLV